MFGLNCFVPPPPSSPSRKCILQQDTRKLFHNVLFTFFFSLKFALQSLMTSHERDFSSSVFFVHVVASIWRVELVRSASHEKPRVVVDLG